MGEINKSGEDEKDIKTEDGADNQDESQKDGGADGEAEGADKSDDDNTDGDDGDGADDGEPDDKKDGESKSKPTPNADEEPKTRKRNVDFIIERKNRKIEKLKDKKDDAGKKEDEDDDGLDPEDAEIIDRRVGKILSPFISKQMQEEDKIEIDSFVKANPDFAPYVAKVQKYLQHPSRKDIPVSSIFYEVAGPDLLKIGADRRKKADDEARESGAGAGGDSKVDTEKGVWDLSPEEFALKQEEIRRKQRE
jgi:hypothetical protein